jgi:hypothetical protein
MGQVGPFFGWQVNGLSYMLNLSAIICIREIPGHEGIRVILHDGIEYTLKDTDARRLDEILRRFLVIKH